MSALTYFLTSRRNILLLALSLLLLPHAFATASELPIGVTERQTCGALSVDIYSYGAGMLHTTNPITTTNRRVAYMNATQGCAVIEWDSNIPAATQVIVAKLSDEPVTIDPTAENFGYPMASTQNNAGIANHRAIVSGLEAGEAYSYRLVTRSHPSALPTISDPQVLITGSTAVFNPVNPTVTPTPTTPTVIAVPVPTTPPSTNTQTFDFEKFPIVPDTTPTGATEGEMGTEEPTTTSTTSTSSVPSAITAAGEALADSREREFFSGIAAFFKGLLPKEGRLSLSSNVGLFEEDKYIIPTLFFLALIFLLQRLVLPAFGLTLQNPVLYWLVGAVVLTVLSALFMLYYVTLIGIALFLGLLAWYLLKSTPENGDGTSPQLKLLETKEAKKNTPAKADKKNKK